jgi:hypothetical protein
MEITRDNWPNVAALILEHEVGEILRVTTPQGVIFGFIINDQSFELSAKLARELFSERELPLVLYEGMVEAGLRGK